MAFTSTNYSGTMATPATLTHLGIARRALAIHDGLSIVGRVMVTAAEIEAGLRMAAPSVFFANLADKVNMSNIAGCTERAVALRTVAAVVAKVEALVLSQERTAPKARR